MLRIYIINSSLFISVSLCLASFPSHADKDSELLNSFHIEGANIYGGLKKIHEDDRGIYFYGALIWNDPKWDPKDYETIKIIAFLKPEDVTDPLIGILRAVTNAEFIAS